MSENNLKRLYIVEEQDFKVRETFSYKLRTDRRFQAMVRHGLVGLMLDSIEKPEMVKPDTCMQRGFFTM
jgi:hypothetical protein